MKALSFRLIVLALCLPALSVGAQPERPIPYPLDPIRGFDRAVERGTRTTTGHPGAEYWTNTATYRIQAELDPATATLTGVQTVQYFNNSPSPIDRMVIHLRQNLHRPEAIRNRFVPITGGMTVEGLAAGGRSLEEVASFGRPGYILSGTLMYLTLPAPIEPGGEATLEMAWHMDIPPEGAPRMGHDGEVFFLGYWYPQIAVYDDLVGWKAEQYQGDGEFYMGYADYEVDITVPEGWLVAATGTLQNADQVLPTEVRGRLERAATTDEMVRVVRSNERRAGRSTAFGDNGRLTWRFAAENVRDFAFGTSDQYVWDATRARTGENGHTMIHALYRPGASSWQRSAEFTRFSIEHMSEMVMPYPYPHMTSVEGAIGGGMEYPMITIIGGRRNDLSLFNVTYHEVAHMWFPMIVGTDEKQYMWMDEGMVSFNTNLGTEAFFDIDPWREDELFYHGIAGAGIEVPSMRHSDEYPIDTMARLIASYTKPALMLRALQGMVGEDLFLEAYREFARRWAFRHPTPLDFFNTFEDVVGENLWWFWRSAFYETWTMEHVVADVRSDEEAVTVTIADEGDFPMPAPVRVTYSDGRTVDDVVPVDVWLSGRREGTLRFPAGDVVRVEIDPDGFLPYLYRIDNVWER
jgi:hypothetical protein